MGKFSGDNMIPETDYFMDCVEGVGSKTWEKIMNEATTHVPVGARRSATEDVVIQAPTIKRRALIADDESD